MSENSKKQTAVEWLEQEIKRQQERYIDLAKNDKSKKKGVNAILTASTFILMKIKQAKEMEKEQIIEAHGCKQYHKRINGEQYYNETYGNQN